MRTRAKQKIEKSDVKSIRIIYAAGKIHWLWKHKTEIRQKLVQWIKVFVKELRIWMKHVKAQERPVKKQ